MPDHLKPLFVARRSYRRRRLIDASRMLPALGGLLFLVPLLWEQGNAAGGSLAGRTLYLFLIWSGLIVSAFLLAGRLVRDDEADEDRTSQPAPYKGTDGA